MHSPGGTKMRDRSNRPSLILFAKAPVPGQVKTRLMPELDAREAAQVAILLIEHTVRLALENWPGPVTLHAWPDPNHAVFKNLADAHGVALAQQSRGNLGEKMHNAISSLTRGGTPAALMGCDVPQCPGEVLREAYALLRQRCDIIGPTIDGGYYLIGLQQSHQGLFENMQWGSESVMESTLAAAQYCGIHFTCLPPLRDLDCFEDLTWAAKRMPALKKWVKPSNN